MSGHFVSEPGIEPVNAAGKQDKKTGRAKRTKKTNLYGATKRLRDLGFDENIEVIAGETVLKHFYRSVFSSRGNPRHSPVHSTYGQQMDRAEELLKLRGRKAA